MLVVPSESLKEASSFKAFMERFASLLSLPRAGPEVHNEVSELVCSKVVRL